MDKENIIQSKSYAFALHIVDFYRHLIGKKEYVMSKQLLKSGTSVGDNIAEGVHGQSKDDFIAKLSIAHKEAHETRFWLRLLRDGGYTSEEEVKALLSEVNEIIAILTYILNTARRKVSKATR